MLLGIETSGSAGSVALVSGGEIRAERSFRTRQEACRLLPGAVAELAGDRPLRELGLAGIGVSCGPGAFTGLRVGIAFAKAVAHALGVPVVGVPTPQVWAAQALPQAGEDPVGVVQAAWRGHLYLAVYAPGDPPSPLAPATVLPAAECAAELRRIVPQGRVLITGDWEGREALSAAQPWAVPPAQGPLSPTAATVARLAEPRLATTPLASAFTLRAEYLARSQAERNRGVDLGL